MLTQLSIYNIALIDELHIEFPDGFSCLTGETGAGKSIIIGALNFVLGERASRDIIRTGEQKARTEAVFKVRSGRLLKTLDEMGLTPDGDEVVLYRELSASGRGVCRINGTMVTVQDLKTVGDLICDIHGQHEHQRLLNRDNHISFLDAYGSKEVSSLIEACSLSAREAKSFRRQLRDLNQNSRERARREDLYRYQLQEIDAAALTDGEEEKLLETRTLQKNSARILDAVETVISALSGDGGTQEILNGARHALEGIKNISPSYAAPAGKLDEAFYTLEDVHDSLVSLRDGLNFEPEDLEKTEERLALIEELKRKYGATILEILAYRDKIAGELSTIAGADERIAGLTDSYHSACRAYKAAAEKLSAVRKETALKLAAGIQGQLKDLGMGHAVFEVVFKPLSFETIPDNGIDDVEFMLSANAGEELKPLSRVASGGELSRIMLAFKRILADSDDIDTMVFDEIDTGISGAVGNAVGKKMAEIAVSRQVLCITHLPQIAACADAQYMVYKHASGDRTVTSVKRLGDEERAVEIARIMGAGAEDASAIGHAREMLLKAREGKL